MSYLILPGLIDAHVHLREPGATHKEDVYTGSAAALAGGVIGILDMPNNTPPTVDGATLSRKVETFRQKAVSDYSLFLGFDGRHVPPLAELGRQVAGLKLYLDETFGDMTTREPRALAGVFATWPGPGPIAIHAESPSIRVALELARRYGQRLHVCHVPDPDDLLEIEAARQAGVAVTCEVTPHHLFLTENDARRLGPYGDMRPTLATQADVDYLWQNLDAIDVIATDHAPHSRQEKDGAKPPPGAPGLETALPLMLTAVAEERITLERVVEMMHTAPRRIFGLPEQAETWIDVDLDERWTIPASGFHSKCDWSPFAGRQVQGRVRRVTLRGALVFDNERGLVGEARGRLLF